MESIIELIADAVEPAAAPQGSAAWLEARLGKYTASNHRRVKRLRGGDWSAETISYLWELVAERLTGRSSDHYVTAAMQWGKDNEPHAKAAYAALTGTEGIACGLVDHPTIPWLAASPDWLVGDDGLVETKCPTSPTHARWLESEECPPDYHGQMLLQLACTGRAWCDFVTFDPRVLIESQRIKVWRFEPPRELIERTEAEAVEFLSMVEAKYRGIVG